MRRKTTLAYIGLGSNLDDPRLQVTAAIDSLDELLQCKVIQRSSLYASEPVGFVDQPEFVNAVCQIETTREPEALLADLLNIEDEQGRMRTSLRNRPRQIDLDLLLYGCEQINRPHLTVPHPRMHERRFVLEPLVEINPQLTIPQLGSAIDLLNRCKDQQVARLEYK